MFFMKGGGFSLYVPFYTFNFESEILFFFINVDALNEERDVEIKWRGAYLSAPQIFQSELKNIYINT